MKKDVHQDMRKLVMIFEWKTYLATMLAVISFSNFMAVLFGQTIPNIVVDFFRVAGDYVVLGAVFVFAMTWLLKAKPHNRPKSYSVMIFDVYGKQTIIDGIRTEFKTHDVAWSYMKQYKASYPMCSFALVSETPRSEKPTIFRYI